MVSEYLIKMQDGQNRTGIHNLNTVLLELEIQEIKFFHFVIRIII